VKELFFVLFELILHAINIKRSASRETEQVQKKHTTKVKFSLISIFDSMELWIQLEVVLAKSVGDHHIHVKFSARNASKI
jgi:hypothetical protein